MEAKWIIQNLLVTTFSNHILDIQTYKFQTLKAYQYKFEEDAQESHLVAVYLKSFDF